jgi:threonine/homoserine/homoserine lactone efflux protein
MKDPIQFCLSVLTLLAVPGPTNTLLAASAAMVGFRRSVPLLLGELAGYLVSIVILRAALGALVGQSGDAQIVLRILVATYLAYLSIRLWRVTPASAALTVNVRRVFVVTLLNPKAFVFALFLIPAEPADPVFYYGAFALLITVVGAAWVLAGHVARRFAGDSSVTHVAKVASFALAAFAAIVIVDVFR